MDKAGSHLKPTIMGREVVVAATEGKMHFGPWEQILYWVSDGKRRERVHEDYRGMSLRITQDYSACVRVRDLLCR